MLNLIKRNLGKCTNKVKSKAYTSLVCPILEYATQVWDPYQKSLIYKIEMIQRRTARWVFSNYDFHSSVSSMLKDLNWSTLEERRKASRLTLLSRIVHHQEPAIQMPQYFLPQTSTTRQFHQLHFVLPPSHTQHYQESFFYRTTKEWNELPPPSYDKLLNQHL